MRRIPFTELEGALSAAFRALGFAPERGWVCARLFAETTCDGVYTHGVNRLPRFVAMVRNGNIDVHATPERVAGFGALERWDGRRGSGNLNAWASMARAIELARDHGIGCLALRNTNHWMRGGTYGRQAADAGMIGICWSNTLPNLPAWGAREACLGNNPLIIAVPHPPAHLVVDMAMSQFSYGSLEAYRMRGELLPCDGGFDSEGRLTRDSAAIEESQRPLPIGYWKGSGLAMVLDTIAAMTSLGTATHQLSKDPLQESGISQMFFAIHPASLGTEAELAKIVEDVVASVHRAAPARDGAPVRYPGEKTLQIREENMRLGVPVEDAIWQQITELANS